MAGNCATGLVPYCHQPGVNKARFACIEQFFLVHQTLVAEKVGLALLPQVLMH